MSFGQLVLAATTPGLWSVYAPYATKLPGYPELIVPKGFTTDLASIPRALRGLPAFDPNGASRFGAVPHDWLYWWQGWGKERADDFLRDAMLAAGCSRADADAFHHAVVWFGHSSWEDATRGGLASHFDTPENYKAYLATVPAI